MAQLVKCLLPSNTQLWWHIFVIPAWAMVAYICNPSLGSGWEHKEIRRYWKLPDEESPWLKKYIKWSSTEEDIQH